MEYRYVDFDISISSMFLFHLRLCLTDIYCYIFDELFGFSLDIFDKTLRIGIIFKQEIYSKDFNFKRKGR